MATSLWDPGSPARRGQLGCGERRARSAGARRHLAVGPGSASGSGADAVRGEQLVAPPWWARRRPARTAASTVASRAATRSSRRSDSTSRSRISAHIHATAWSARSAVEGRRSVRTVVGQPLDLGPRLVDARAGEGRRGHDRHGPSRVLGPQQVDGVAGSRPRPGGRPGSRSPSALLTTMTSASSMIPRLMPCSSSPPPGAASRTKQSTMSATTVSDWPTPTVSTSTTSKPAASHSSIASRVRRATPPRVPPDGDGRMNACGSRARRSMRVLSPMIEPPLRRLDGSTASTATRCPAAVRRDPSSSMKVDLPAPGRAADADPHGARRWRAARRRAGRRPRRAGRAGSTRRA